ncbi:hypothetical protein BGK46_14760 [Salinivibrio sp. SS2]|nr:hypothetical protein BGK46_14760 [Salinivibrio sp. DV]
MMGLPAYSFSVSETATTQAIASKWPAAMSFPRRSQRREFFPANTLSIAVIMTLLAASIVMRQSQRYHLVH